MTVDNVSGINQPDQVPTLGATQGDDDSNKTTDSGDTSRAITYDDINNSSFAPSITDYLQMLQMLQDLLEKNPPSSDDEKNIQDLLNALQQKVYADNPLHLSSSSLNDLSNIINNPTAINCSNAIKHIGQVNEDFNATLLKLVETESAYFEGEIGELYDQLNLSSKQQEIINALMSYVEGMPQDLGDSPEEQAKNTVKINNIMYSITHGKDGGESMLDKLNDMLNGEGGLNDLIAQLQADLKENPNDPDKSMRLSQMTSLQTGLDGIYQELKGLSDQGLGQTDMTNVDINKMAQEIQNAEQVNAIHNVYNNYDSSKFHDDLNNFINDITGGVGKDFSSKNPLKWLKGIAAAVGNAFDKDFWHGIYELLTTGNAVEAADKLIDTFPDKARQYFFGDSADAKKLSSDDMQTIINAATSGNEAFLNLYCKARYGVLTPEMQCFLTVETDYNKTDSGDDGGDGSLVKLSNLADLLRNAKDEVTSSSTTANNNLNQKEMEWSQVMQTISNLIKSFAQIALDVVKKPM